MRRTRARFATVAALVALGAAVALTGCTPTPSNYVAERGTEAILARRLGIAITSADVTCRPGPGDLRMRHTCTAPVGPGGAKESVVLRVSWVVTATEKSEVPIVTFPASWARNSLKRPEKGYQYQAFCGWRPDKAGV